MQADGFNRAEVGGGQAERLRPREAAAYIGVAEGTLASWRSRAVNLRFRRIGGAIFYDRAELDRFLSAGDVEVAS